MSMIYSQVSKQSFVAAREQLSTMSGVYHIFLF